MRNNGKQGQSSQRQMNDYERRRMLRIQENQGKLQEFGVKNIVKSLTSLVEGQSLKKRKQKPIVTHERDVEYVPDFGADNEDNYEEEVAKSVKAPKKVHHRQYIAPMSMNRYANLAKQRVIAPNAPRILQSGEGTDLANSNVTKRSRIQPFEKNQLRNEKSIYTNATELDEPRMKMTMGELILNKKGSQRQVGVFEHNVVNSNSITRSTSSGARRKLFIVDDDGEDDVTSQDVVDKDCVDDDDDNEDTYNMILRNGIEGNDMIYQDVNEVHSNHNSLEDDENEEIDQFISEGDENQQDGPEDDLEIEDDEFVQEQLIAKQSDKRTAISNSKKRGPTMLHVIHTRNFDEHEVIICNEFAQPIGPVRKEKDTAGQFSRFLGTIARNDSFAPLTHASWHKVPHKEKIWQYVLEKYVVPKDARDWVLKSIGASWRVYKCRMKNKHFYKYNDNKSRWKNRPKCIPEKDFATLLRLWSNKEEMKRCSLARDRRMSQKNMHTAGPKSFARIREELKNEDPNKELPNLTKMFEYTRRRTEGRVYVDTYDDTAMKIEKMKNYKPHEEDSSADEDPFLAVMGKEYDGHRRLYGKGVTNKLIKKVRHCEKSTTAPSKPIESTKDVEVEKHMLLDMRKELDEEHERKKAELEVDHQRKKDELEAIRKDIDNQRDKSIEDAVKKILQKLPVGIVQEYLT